MNRGNTYNKAKYILVIAIWLGVTLTACQYLPIPQADTPVPESQPATQTPAASLPTPTAPEETEPTSAPEAQPTAQTARFAPGETILEQSFTLNALSGGEAEATFESDAFQTIRLDVSLLSGNLEYELQLVDKFGNFLASLQSTVGRSTEAISEFTLPYEGEYRLVIYPIERDGTLQVTVTALGPASGGGQLDGLNSVVNAMMSAIHTGHTYQFPLTEGDVVTLAARSTVPGSPDTRLALYGPDGRFITEVDDVVPATELDAVLSGFVVPETGVYTVVVSNYGEGVGAYNFSVTSDTVPPEAEGGPDLVYGSAKRALFFDQSNLRLSFDSTVGDVLQISVFDATPDLDVDIYVYSPFGQIIAYARDARQGEGETLHEMQMPYSGRYVLELQPIGEGEASFQVTQLAPSALTGGGSFGDQASGNLPGAFAEQNVFHFYQFNAAAGDRISLVVTSSSTEDELDIGFALIAPNGLQLAFADHSEGANSADPALLGYRVTQTGTYTVIVYTFNAATGTYELQYERE